MFLLGILLGHPTVLGTYTRFWCPLVPSNASRKFSRRRDIMEWVFEMFSRSRATRRIKNQSHTMSQSKVMGAKVKSVGQKNVPHLPLYPSSYTEGIDILEF